MTLIGFGLISIGSSNNIFSFMNFTNSLFTSISCVSQNGLIVKSTHKYLHISISNIYISNSYSSIHYKLKEHLINSYDIYRFKFL